MYDPISKAIFGHMLDLMINKTYNIIITFPLRYNFC